MAMVPAFTPESVENLRKRWKSAFDRVWLSTDDGGPPYDPRHCFDFPDGLRIVAARRKCECCKMEYRRLGFFNKNFDGMSREAVTEFCGARLKELDPEGWAGGSTWDFSRTCGIVLMDEVLDDLHKS